MQNILFINKIETGEIMDNAFSRTELLIGKDKLDKLSSFHVAIFGNFNAVKIISDRMIFILEMKLQEEYDLLIPLF